jgi:hypothetical protein
VELSFRIKFSLSRKLGGYELPAISKQQNVFGQCKKPTAQMAHLVFADTQPNAEKTKRAIFCQRSK